MVYNWDGKEEECYRLYVNEKRSLNEVVEYWRQRGFTPSKRAFQTQFKRWGFPGKQSPAYKDQNLIARVKELWEKNTSQKVMLEVLQAEGFQINDRELMRVRTRFKWFLREGKTKGNCAVAPKKKETSKAAKKTKRVEGIPTGNGPIDQLAAAILQEAGTSEEESEEEHNDHEHSGDDAAANQSESIPRSDALDPAEALRRQLRQQQLQAESNEKWRARKRRRRTRGWAGLPADAPGEPPRFPSETTLDESKAYLNLDNKLYAQIRAQFQAICREQGVIKKTVAGPEKWVQLLQRLIRENHHLSATFQQHPEVFHQADALWKPKNYKTLSLDVICQDVTKRMRVMETRMSLAEAKNALNLNPAQTREVKHAFYEILKADHFTNKFETGSQHWNELKQRWVDGSELLREAIAAPVDDAERMQRLRAVEVLACDVMKRLRAETTRYEKVASGQGTTSTHRGPGPGPAPPTVPQPSLSSRAITRSRTTRSTHGSANASAALENVSRQQDHTPRDIEPLAPDADLQIDPSLLLAASDAVLPFQLATVPTLQHQPQHLDYRGGPHPDPNLAHPHTHAPNPLRAFPTSPHYLQPTHAAAPSAGTANPLPIYLRLHPRSVTPFPHKSVWLSVLQGRGGVDDVRKLAAREHPGTVVLGLEGVLASRGEEICVGIDNDGELGAYLGHVRAGTGGGSGKVTFMVTLGMAGR
ncbi:hypothetical protein BU23DRAFT_555818 [Bimuria novae-zelandiae CBS 107.79]|uniref:Uncharacterized protein n=1 Tax=Bimuria novae-zelandiae CBS 107.79 TaxID=1447943 RepID=A0A6A5V2G6_9PLEO|nr:hypothetical protein BU23DRAFT_555818 [Bimuria novae-zelandiae CBS 107.79]